MGIDEAPPFRCADCGIALEPELERGYSFGPESVICFDCAVKRGGHYDEVEDRWRDRPNLDNLRPSTP